MIPYSCPVFDKAIEQIESIEEVCDTSSSIEKEEKKEILERCETIKELIEEAREINKDLRSENSSNESNYESKITDLKVEIDNLEEDVEYLTERLKEFEDKEEKEKKEREIQGQFFSMKLHEIMTLKKEFLFVMRVQGGWIYYFEQTIKRDAMLPGASPIPVNLSVSAVFVPEKAKADSFEGYDDWLKKREHESQINIPPEPEPNQSDVCEIKLATLGNY
jgi:Rad3-related DNA helicase